MTLKAGEATVEVRPDASEFGQDLKRDTGRAFQDVERQADKAGRNIGQTLKAGFGGAAKGAALVSAPIAAFFTVTARSYSDYAESVNASQAIFRDASSAVEEWAENGIKHINANRGAAQEMANQLGAMVTTYRDNDSAAEATIDLLERAADVGSVFNAETAQVAEAISGVLRGEAEMGRRYGIFVSDAQVQAKAVAAGLVEAEVNANDLEDAQLKVEEAQRKATEATEEHGQGSMEARRAQVDLAQAEEKLAEVVSGKVPDLDEATKAHARELLVMEQTERFKDDLKKTYNETANVSRRAAEEATEAQIQAGEHTEAAYREVMETLGSLASMFNSLPDGIQKSFIIAAGAAAALAPLVGAWNAVAGAATRARIAQLGAAGAGGAGGVGRAAGASRWAATLGKGGASLGLGTTAGVAVASGLAGWSFGSWVEDQWGLGTKAGEGIADLLGMADGGTVNPDGTVKPLSGRVVHLAEGGEREHVVPESRATEWAQDRAGGSTTIHAPITIVSQGPVDAAAVSQLAPKIADEFDRRARRRTATRRP